MVSNDPAIAVARATSQRRSGYAILLVAAALAVAVIAAIGWNSSKPDALASSAQGAANALACTTNGIDCNESVPGADPMWLYVGGAIAGVLLLIALVLFVSRPAVPPDVAVPPPATD